MYHSQPSTSSSSSKMTTNRLPPYARNTLRGQTARERELQIANRYSYGHDDDEKKKVKSSLERYKGVKTEFDILKENMRFIRPDEDPNSVTWESRLARAYESKLFKEYALVDLKHFKSRRVALRWRTAEEVIGAVGENTCGSIRCAWHLPLPIEQQQEQGWGSEAMRVPKMKAFELPFAYEEDGQKQTALVKVKVCERCERKLVYRPGKEKEENGETQDEERERRRSMSHHSEADDRSDGQRRPRSSSLSRSRYAKEADSRVKFDRGIHRRGSASPRPR